MAEFLLHEIEWLKAAIDEGHKENDTASRDMADAISSGNAWHDNPAYDEVVARMETIDTKYGYIGRLLAEATAVDYPSIPGVITVGSLVELGTPFDGYVILSSSPSLTESRYQELWQTQGRERDELEVCDTASPLGETLLGMSEGETVDWQVGDRTLHAQIAGIDNEWVVANFKSVNLNESVTNQST